MGRQRVDRGAVYPHLCIFTCLWALRPRPGVDCPGAEFGHLPVFPSIQTHSAGSLPAQFESHSVAAPSGGCRRAAPVACRSGSQIEQHTHGSRGTLCPCHA